MVVIVDVRLAGVVLFLFLAAVVVAVGERAVIVLVRVPRGLMLPLPDRQIIAVMVGDVPVVVCVGDGRMRMHGRLALAMDGLWRRSSGCGGFGGLIGWILHR